LRRMCQRAAPCIEQERFRDMMCTEPLCACEIVGARTSE